MDSLSKSNARASVFQDLNDNSRVAVVNMNNANTPLLEETVKEPSSNASEAQETPEQPVSVAISKSAILRKRKSCWEKDKKHWYFMFILSEFCKKLECSFEAEISTSFNDYIILPFFFSGEIGSAKVSTFLYF